MNPTTDDFTRLFLCALVLRGIRHIHVRGERAKDELRRLYALHAFLNERVDSPEVREDRNFLHFVLRVRNEWSPGSIGSFDGFYGAVRSKMTTIISIELPYCDYYTI